MADPWQKFHEYRRGLFQHLGYTPSEEQERFHSSRKRIRLLAGGERSGKSFSSTKDALARMTYIDTEVAIYWLLGPDYEQPRIEFQYLLDDLRALGREPRSLSMPITKTQAWTMMVEGIGQISTKTTHDVRKIASVPLYGAMMCEAAQQDFEVFLKARGRIAEKRGWLIMSGTFETSLGWYPSYYDRWQTDNIEDAESFAMPSWSNLAVYPGGRDDPEIKALEATFPEDVFWERFGARPMRPATLVFREFNYDDHVRDWVRFDDTKQVMIWVDPGYYPGHYAVIAAQAVYDEESGTETIWLVDEVYEQGKTGPEVIQVCQEREWWDNVKDGVMDIAGRQHNAMKSQQEVWLQEGGIYLRSNQVPILDGIMRHRTFLRDPATGLPRLLHAPHLTNIFEEYNKYKRPADNEGRPVQEVPIDRHNHAMKAIAYGLYDRYGPVHRERRTASKVHTFRADYLTREGRNLSSGTRQDRRKAGRVLDVSRFTS